jgi:phage terminase large subunit GpA-like protein
MLTITVFRNVLTGNMGEGWMDDYAAAMAYAAHLRDALTAYAQGSYPEAQIDVRMTVQRASGDSGNLDVVSNLPGWRAERLRAALCETASHAWETFGESERAETLRNA